MPFCITLQAYSNYLQTAYHGSGANFEKFKLADLPKTDATEKVPIEPCDYYRFGDKLQSEKNDYQRLCKVGIRLPQLYEIVEL